jgi:hypothetical protein
LTTSPNFGTNLLPAERPPARRHHFGTPGDIISESAGDFVGICNLGSDSHFVGAANGPLVQIPGTGVIWKICPM